MIHNIRAAFNEILEESSWMDDETKAVAKEKVGFTHSKCCRAKITSNSVLSLREKVEGLLKTHYEYALLEVMRIHTSDNAYIHCTIMHICSDNAYS